MQHEAPLVVVLVTEAAGDALDLLDDAVVALGGRRSKGSWSWAKRRPGAPNNRSLISLNNPPGVLRREGLYHSHIKEWASARDAGAFSSIQRLSHAQVRAITPLLPPS